jgi:hypothetical protein
MDQLNEQPNEKYRDNLFFSLGDLGVLAVDTRRVESRGVLAYSNSALLEAVPTPLLP